MSDVVRKRAGDEQKTNRGEGIRGRSRGIKWSLGDETGQKWPEPEHMATVSPTSENKSNNCASAAEGLEHWQPVIL